VGPRERSRSAQPVAAVDVDRFSAPQTHEDLQSLIEERGAFPVDGLLSEGRELHLRVGAEADAERHPSSGEVIERHRLARNLPRTTTWERRDHRADPNALRRDRDRGERDPRVGHRRLPADEVVPHEEPVPAGRLRVAREIGVEARISVRTEVLNVEAEPHDAAQPTCSPNQYVALPRSQWPVSERTYRPGGTRNASEPRRRSSDPTRERG